MKPRLLAAGVGLLLLLSSGSVLAQGARGVAAPDSGAAPGRAGIGGLIGVSQFIADGDYSEGAMPRFALSGSFRYVMNDWLRWQVSPGFTWTGYDQGTAIPFADPNFPADTNKDEMLALLVPVSAQAQILIRSGKWMHHVGAGPGLYRVWVQNRRKVLKDPVTKDLHRGLYPGGTAQIGTERFLNALPNTSVEISLAGHWVLAERNEQFPSGYNSIVSAVEFRVGANYYFDLKGDKPLTELPPATGGE